MCLMARDVFDGEKWMNLDVVLAGVYAELYAEPKSCFFDGLAMQLYSAILKHLNFHV
jgi:hypothetical protein